MEYVAIYSDDALSHHGVKGQKWGYRRWQNEDGSLTSAGKEHYSKGLAGFRKGMKERKIGRIDKRIAKEQKFLNDPKTQVKLARANQKSAKYEAAKSVYLRKQNRADRAWLFKGMKQRSADRAYNRMMRANRPSSQNFIARYKTVEYNLAVDTAKRDRVTNSYIRRYSQESYDEMMAKRG